MDPYRTDRLNQAIRVALGELLQTTVKDPRVGMVSVNEVRLNRDHSVARIMFSVMGDEQERQDSFAGLKQARGFLQARVARSLGLRQAPELRFEYDDSVAQGLEVGGVLDGLAASGEFLDEAERRRRLTLDDFTPPDDLLAGLHVAERLWVVPHFNPDPDAVGSALALAEALRASGREARVVAYADPPAGVTELPGFAEVAVDFDPQELYDTDAPDALVLVDCHRIDRCGPLEDTLARIERRWCVDHHLVSGRKAPEPGWIEPRACSTCTLIHQVIGALASGGGPLELTPDMATNLYAGLYNDTGGFRFDNTLPFSFELARRLAAHGVDTAQVAARTLHRHRAAGVAMLQRVLGTFTYHAAGRVVAGHATLDMLAETGATMGDTEGFINLAMSIDAVQMAAFMKELEPGIWRVSLRARPGGDVQSIAAEHGGGGHLLAAGCTLEGTVDEVTDQLVAELAAALP